MKLFNLLTKIQELLLNTKFEWLIAYDPKGNTWNIQIKEK